MLHKGKGDTEDLNAYRGIALENNPYIFLTKIIMTRTTEALNRQIPDQQFGFWRGHSALQAVELLLRDIEESLQVPRQKIYAMFVDFPKAFDSVNRRTLLEKLTGMNGLDAHTVALIHNILARNYIQTVDTIQKSKEVTQTRGVPQGDPLSPVLFIT